MTVNAPTLATRPTERDEQRQGVNAWRRGFRAGFISMLPLWPGAIAFAIAFAISARSAGFSLLEAQALSMLVFAGSA